MIRLELVQAAPALACRALGDADEHDAGQQISTRVRMTLLEAVEPVGVQDEANAPWFGRPRRLRTHSTGSCAEAVENDEAWHRVRALGRDVVQGFLIAKPMP